MRYKAPRGAEDVLPTDSPRWLWIESRFRDLARRYGYAEIRTPTFEETELFVRSSGETSDVVSKQMYTFLDKGGRSMTLKPEGTAPVIRAALEHSLCPPGTVSRLMYVTPIYRYERPQKGRLREAHQLGLELVGSASPVADAEVIDVTVAYYREIGITESRVLVNSIGRQECRARYRETVLRHAAAYLADLDEEARSKIERNPLRLLDSKDPDAQAIVAALPSILDCLEEDSRARFDRLCELLAFLEVPFVVAPEIVRGLDYYTDTVFEVHSTRLGAQSALCGGGRYDGLIDELGGPPTPSVGVAMGIERALIVLDELNLAPPNPKPDAFVISAGGAAAESALEIAREVRQAGLAAIVDPDSRSLRSQLRQADRAQARFAVVVGDEEIARGVVQLRDLAAGAQREVPRGDLVETLRRGGA